MNWIVLKWNRNFDISRIENVFFSALSVQQQYLLEMTEATLTGSMAYIQYARSCCALFHVGHINTSWWIPVIRLSIAFWDASLALRQSYYCHWTCVRRPLRIWVTHNNRPVAQMPQFIRPISNSAPLCNRNVHTHLNIFLLPNGELWDISLMHCGIHEMEL